MGVTGAAIGTNIGRGSAVLDAALDADLGPGRILIRRPHLRLVPSVMWNVCRLSGSGFLQILIDTSSYIGLVRVISTFGSEALAGYTIGIRTGDLRDPAGVGSGQRGRHDGRAGARREEARARGRIGVDRRRSTTRSCSAWSASRSSCSRRRSLSIYTSDPAVAPYAIELPADRQRRLRVLRLRPGVHAGVQRRGRHVDADVDQSGLLLGSGRSRWRGCWRSISRWARRACSSR